MLTDSNLEFLSIPENPSAIEMEKIIYSDEKGCVSYICMESKLQLRSLWGSLCTP